MVKGYEYRIYEEAASYIRGLIDTVPDIAVVLGTGCQSFKNLLENKVIIPYSSIPHFPVTTNKSHEGLMIAGYIKGKYILVLSGRFHYYEGYTMEELNIPVHVLYILGIKRIVLTNASGSCNFAFRPGDAMIIKDHIKLFGGSPMRGPNIEELGPRFFSVGDLYTAGLRKKALECAERASLSVHEGVYMFFPGPQFETKAEINAARILGADAVGMSTVTEALTAAHSGMEVLAITLITNMATGLVDNVDGNEVDEVALKAAPAFTAYLLDVIMTILE